VGEVLPSLPLMLLNNPGLTFAAADAVITSFFKMDYVIISNRRHSSETCSQELVSDLLKRDVLKLV
jgi:hypothetical protein